MDINHYDIILTKSAKENLTEIYSYISQNLKEPSVANKLMQRIEKSIFNLERLPYIHQKIHIKLGNKKYRRLIVGNYIILYKIDESNKIVYISNVIYGKKDYLKYF